MEQDADGTVRPRHAKCGRRHHGEAVHRVQAQSERRANYNLAAKPVYVSQLSDRDQGENAGAHFGASFYFAFQLALRNPSQDGVYAATEHVGT